MLLIKYLLLVVFLIIIIRLFRFITTPILKFVGFYKYYSPMLMTVPLPFNIYDIHLGTSWDFLRISETHPRKMIRFILEGFVNIANDIENGKIKPNKSFRGNTFYLKESTIIRFGFRTRKMNLIETLLFILNYAELCLLNSIYKKRFYLIPTGNIMIVTFNANDILANKRKFENMILKLYYKLPNEQFNLSEA